ncbi:hypothetical protein C8Q78DRAFT_106365 [Trametes maxima]|nr:hypothetical protein C8Q78DRAFT_106365 [Trametes maxima]
MTPHPADSPSSLHAGPPGARVVPSVGVRARYRPPIFQARLAPRCAIRRVSAPSEKPSRFLCVASRAVFKDAGRGETFFRLSSTLSPAKHSSSYSAQTCSL